MESNKIIPYNTQYTDSKDIKSLIDLFNSGGFLTCGPKVSEFENNQPMDTSFLGEDNNYVLEGMLGYEPQRIKKLIEEGVLFENPET